MKNYIRFIKLILPHSGIFILGVLSMLLGTLFSASPLALIIPMIDIVIMGKKIPLPEGIDVPFVNNIIEKVNSMEQITILNMMAVLLVIFFFSGACSCSLSLI